MGITFHANGDVTGSSAGRFGASGTVLQTVQNFALPILGFKKKQSEVHDMHDFNSINRSFSAFFNNFYV